MLEILLNKKLNDDLIFPVDKGVCKNGDDCICLPEWSGALCDQGKLKNGIMAIPSTCGRLMRYIYLVLWDQLFVARFIS
jgi:hypothetical protein